MRFEVSVTLKRDNYRAVFNDYDLTVWKRVPGTWLQMGEARLVDGRIADLAAPLPADARAALEDALRKELDARV